MRSDQPRNLVRTYQQGFRGRSGICRIHLPCRPCRCSVRRHSRPPLWPPRRTPNLRRRDVDLAIEDRDQRGQHAIRDRNDELQEQLPAHTVTRITDSSIRALALGRPRSIGERGAWDLHTVEWATSAINGSRAERGPGGQWHEAQDQLPDRDSYTRLTRRWRTSPAGGSAPVCAAVLVTLA